MQKHIQSVIVLVLLCPGIATVCPSIATAQSKVATFSLPTTSGETVELSTDPSVNLEVLVFLGTECPLAKMYAARLQSLADDFYDDGVRFIGINSNVQDSMEELTEYAAAHQVSFPLAKDYDQRVALQVGATRTPEAFVVDRGGVVRYQGRIDDQFQVGVSRKAATSHDLRDAIESLLSGQEVAVPRTTAVGCLITLPRKSVANTSTDVTFCNQVMRILQEHCIECHRDGEIAPFALDRYEEVIGWADMSVEVMDTGRMPPWHASPDHGSFLNARQMDEEDKRTFALWVEAGMPYGDAKQLPKPRDYVAGWRLSQKPDLVLPISNAPFKVPADGTVEYQYFVIDPGFKKERWVRAAQVIPGNPAVVHHCIAFTRPPDGGDFRDISLLSAYVPGQIRGELPEGYAQRIGPGSKIVFQMHYTPTGKPEQDLTRLGLVFVDPETVTHEVYALGGINHDFEIPPHDSEYAVSGKLNWFPKNGSLLAVTPHMHLRGKSFQFDLVSADSTETLLKVPYYDFNWQHNYELTQPIALSSIDQLAFTAVFDNSDDNPNNPDPNEFVSWGDQTWQEMALAFITVAEPIAGVERVFVDGGGQERSDERSRRMMEEDEAIQRKWEEMAKRSKSKARKFAEDYIRRFDRNQDGFVAPHELPDSVRIFAMWIDSNGDNRITLEEVETQAFSRAQRNKLPN